MGWLCLCWRPCLGRLRTGGLLLCRICIARLDPERAKKATELLNKREKRGNVIYAEFSKKSEGERLKDAIEKYRSYFDSIEVLNSQRKITESRALGEKLVGEIDFYLESFGKGDDTETQNAINKLTAVRDHIKTIANIG